MTDVEAIDHFIDNGEQFGIALKGVNEELDVHYIRDLQYPMPSTIELLQRAFCFSRKKLIVCGIDEIADWVPFFNSFDCVWLEADENTVVFDKTL